MLNVLCVKSRPEQGAPQYDHEDVNRLREMVRRHLRVPHRFYCLTDNPKGIKCATRTLPGGLYGWWAKLALFQGQFDPPCLYFDLDTLITADISFITRYIGDFAILEDFYRPEGYGSAVMMWTRHHREIWEDWLAKGKPRHVHGDQGWIEEKIKNADRLQSLYPGKIVSYKVHCEKGLPNNAAVVCFHGAPKVRDFDRRHWVQELWAA